jgi:c-di-AMP phosphodiesterase-like protein
MSQENLKLGLNRGGDQVVIKELGGTATFFGATSESKISTSAPEIRMFASDLKEILNISGKVIIMGHKFADFDAIGSALAVMH